MELRLEARKSNIYGIYIKDGAIRDKELVNTTTINYFIRGDLALAPSNNILGLKKDGTIVSAGCLRQHVLIGPIKSNPTAHLKNIVFMYLINNTFVVALAADGTVNTANTELGKTTSILNSWKLW